MKGEISFSFYSLFSLNIQGAALTQRLCVCVCVYRLGPWRHYGEEDEAHSQFPSSLFELAPLHLTNDDSPVQYILFPQ